MNEKYDRHSKPFWIEQVNDTWYVLCAEEDGGGMIIYNLDTNVHEAKHVKKLAQGLTDRLNAAMEMWYGEG